MGLEHEDPDTTEKKEPLPLRWKVVGILFVSLLAVVAGWFLAALCVGLWDMAKGVWRWM